MYNKRAHSTFNHSCPHITGHHGPARKSPGINPKPSLDAKRQPPQTGDMSTRGLELAIPPVDSAPEILNIFLKRGKKEFRFRV